VFKTEVKLFHSRKEEMNHDEPRLGDLPCTESFPPLCRCYMQGSL